MAYAAPILATCLALATGCSGISRPPIPATPERTDALLARGLSFGQSRVVCGVQWQSDVTAGRVMGASAVARLHCDSVFRAELDEARKEVAAARARGIKPLRNCAAEAGALR